MTEKFLNRAAATILMDSGELPKEHWYMVARRGEHDIMVALADETTVFTQVVDEESVTKMLNNFNSMKTADPSFELLVDYDHFSDDTSKSSEAAGWITALQNRDDGLYAQIRWSDRGAEAIKGLRYRYLSPVWNYNDCEKLSNKRVRPLRLDKAAVTNQPNIRGMAPLTNREKNAPDWARKESTMDHKAILLQVLGLEADATEEAITAALEVAKEDKAAAEAAKEELATLQNRVDEYEKKELENAVDEDLEKFKNRFPAGNREKVKAQLLANRAETVKLLELTAPVEDPQRLYNRKNTKQPASSTVTEEQQVLKQEEEIEKIKLKNRCTHSEAAAIAASLFPELFARV